MKLSEIGFGVASFLANPNFSDSEAIALIKCAIENGITYFDTGSSYGGPRGGIAESRLGMAMQGTPRSQLVISTKAGTLYDESNKHYKDFSAAAVEKSIYGSLERLKTDYIDILYLHGPQFSQISSPLIALLERMRQDGVVRACGINTMDNSVVEPFLDAQYAVFEVFLITFNIFTPETAALIERIKACGRSVVAGTAIGRALYSTERLRLYKLSNIWYLLRALANSREALYKSIKLKRIRNIPGLSPVQAALCYALSNKNIASAVFNTTNRDHLLENIQASTMDVDLKKLVEVIS